MGSGVRGARSDAAMGDTILTSPLVGSRPARAPQYFTAFSATLGAFALGSVLGYSSPAGSMLIHNPTHDSVHLDKSQNSLFSSIMNVGALSAGSNISDDVSSIVVGAVQVIATFLATVLMDKAGRKLLLIASSSIMALSLVALGEFFYMKMEDESWATKNLGWLPLASLMVFIFAFSIGFGPIPWLMLGELFSPDVKEIAASQSTMFNWSLSFLVTFIFSPLESALGDAGLYWLFSGLCVVSLLFCTTLVPETKGKTLEEITASFGAPAPSVTIGRPSSSDC
ncbi:Facilitated trehalose transporter Tret1 [Portunus trituberculatus]|uniref:Facilitated trehalose transporter Tret1 n=1 Tax=Portunus trituberculatus TaxID=210409 RepID=A0A5B7DE58_PORTR|nr:Facilitated trehalose transporter Tret1 [Portunus trituberculatus]